MTRRCLTSVCAVLLTALLSLPAAATPASSNGDWTVPVKGGVRRPFDPPSSQWGRGHRGVDLEGAPLALVVAPAAGVVMVSGEIAGVGVVTIHHAGNLRSTFQPVIGLVPEGTWVPAGMPVAVLVPWAHCPPRTCLHWGVIRGRDQYLNPMSLVGPVRLLPWMSST